MCVPVSNFAFFMFFIVFFVGCFILLLMYLDGYWTPERAYQRWLLGDSFTAIDERHALGINRDGTKRKRK